MSSLKGTKGVFELAAVKQHEAYGSCVEVHHSNVRDWPAVLKTATRALGITVLDMRQRKGYIALEFDSEESAQKFVEFAKSE